MVTFLHDSKGEGISKAKVVKKASLLDGLGPEAPLSHRAGMDSVAATTTASGPERRR